MNKLKVGYASVNIDPPLGISVTGYYISRYASGFVDHLEASAMAMTCGQETYLLISVDTCEIFTHIAKQYLQAISEASSPFP